MSDLFFSTMERLSPILKRGELDDCEREVGRVLRKLAPTPFHIVLELSITNEPADTGKHFDRFFAVESKRYKIGAAYTEMNGFDINPDRWYCDLFAYKLDGGEEDFEWISDWQSRPFEDYEINGLEPLQLVYASKAFQEKENNDASYMSSLMVVVKFQRFMQRATSHMKALEFPLYVTAHDFDFIAAFDLRPLASRTPVRKMSAEELLRDLIAKLSDKDTQTRFRAVMKLYSLGRKGIEAVPLLIQRINDPDVPTRQAAIIALAKIDPTSDAVTSALVATLKQEQPAHVRQEIVRALGQSPTKAATDALMAALTDEDKGLRRYSVISLKLLGREAKDAAPALRRLLEIETDEDIRSQAMVALKRMEECI